MYALNVNPPIGINKKELKMDETDLDLIAQTIESMGLVANELEKSINNKNIERINTAKKEILNLQQQVASIIQKQREN